MIVPYTRWVQEIFIAALNAIIINGKLMYVGHKITRKLFIEL